MIKSRKQRLRSALLLVIGILILITPVTLRNVVIGHDNVLIASQGGINFYIGNNEIADGYTAILPGFGHTWQYSDAEYEAAIHTGKIVSEIKPSEVSGYYFDKAISFIQNNPLDYARLIIKKIYLVINRFEISNNNNIGFLTDYIHLPYLPYFMFGLLSPLGIAGAVLCFLKDKKYWILPLLIFGYLATIVLFFVTARFRLPVVPLLAVTSMIFINEFVSFIKIKNISKIIISSILVLVLTFLSWSDLYGHHNQSDAMANYSLGNIFLKKGQRDKAKFQYELASSKAPCVPNAYLNLGVLAFYDNDISSAREMFREELNACGPSAKAYNNLSMLARIRGDFNEAYQLADSAVSFFPSFKEAYINRITAALGASDSVLIGGTVKEFVTAFPDDIAALYYQAILDQRNGANQNAINGFYSVANSGKLDLVAEYDLSVIYSANLPYGYDPDIYRGRSHYQLGLFEAETGDFTAAIDHFGNAIKYIPDYADAFANLALAYDQISDYPQAIEYFRRAIEIDSSDALYYYNYALTLGKTGDYHRSLGMLEKSLAINPDFRQAKNVYDALKSRIGGLYP